MKQFILLAALCFSNFSFSESTQAPWGCFPTAFDGQIQVTIYTAPYSDSKANDNCEELKKGVERFNATDLVQKQMERLTTPRNKELLTQILKELKTLGGKKSTNLVRISLDHKGDVPVLYIDYNNKVYADVLKDKKSADAAKLKDTTEVLEFWVAQLRREVERNAEAIKVKADLEAMLTDSSTVCNN